MQHDRVGNVRLLHLDFLLEALLVVQLRTQAVDLLRELGPLVHLTGLLLAPGEVGWEAGQQAVSGNHKTTHSRRRDRGARRRVLARAIFENDRRQRTT